MNSDNELMARADGIAQNWSTTVTGTVEPGPNSNKWYNTWATCRGVWSRVNPTNGTFSLPGVMLYPGSNVLDVAVVDVSGNVARQTRSVFKTITNCFETFYHDNNGSMTNWINGGQNVVSQWDWADRLVKVTANGSVRVQNWYDASSRRIGKQEYGQTSRSILYVYDGWEIVGVLNANGSLLETFTRGVGIAGDIGTLVATTPHSAGSSYPLQTYEHHNHRGDIVAVRSGTSTITRYTYSAFGSLISVAGPDSSRFKFSSKERDVGTELYYYGYRFYSPQWQRWLNRDVLASGGPLPVVLRLFGNLNGQPWERFEGPNLNTYVRNSPATAIDVNGLWTIGLGVAGSYGFFAGGGISLGFYFGHSEQSGWSFGFLETTFLGAGGPPNIFGGFFGQWTNAKCVSQLKGLGGATGGGGGEVYGGGGDVVYGAGYKGFDVQGGWTFGSPFEVHSGGTFTSGWDSGKGAKW